MRLTSIHLLDGAEQSFNDDVHLETKERVLVSSHLRGGLSPRTLQRVCAYIECHLDRGIRLGDLAKVAGLSRYHFARAFKQSQGTPPHDYLVQRRLKRTQKLLAETDLPLSEIALAAGFSDQSHCARRFRERFGVSPRSYRRAMR